jgi:uncharacterized protein YfiM (DUF2279 family)
MKKLILFVIFLLSISFSNDTLEVKEKLFVREKPNLKKICDPWFSEDKFLHFSVSAALPGFSYYLYVRHLDKGNENSGKIYSISFTALIGISKEIYDKKKKGHFSWKDLFWDGVGLTIGYLVFLH